MLMNLPTEVTIHILELTDYYDMVECRMVCSSLKELVDRVPSLQLAIELGKSGLTSGITGDGCAEQLERLQDLRSRWRTLAWREEISHPIKGHCNAYELVDGLFVKTDREGAILVQDLPTSQNPVHRILAEHQLEIKPGDFAIDNTQDLIVFLNVEAIPGPPDSDKRKASIRVWSLSKLTPHPEAAQHVFYYDVHGGTIWGNTIQRAVTQIAGDVVGTFVSTSAMTRLIIWNWRTGKLVGDSDESPVPSTVHGFTFVSPDLFYVTTLSDPGSIILYTLDPSGETTGFTHVTTLTLPDTQDTTVIEGFGCHTEPYQGKPSSKTFSTVPEKQIHVFTLEYIAGAEFSRHKYRMYAQGSLFFDYLALFRRRGSSSPVIAGWDSWGPFRTRFLPSTSSYSWLRYVQGQRVVSPAHHNPNILEIFDFNVHPTSEPSEQVALCDGPTAIRTVRVFVEPIVSGLPYFITTRTVNGNYDGYMIDHERIVALSVEGELGQIINKLTVFTF